METFVLFRILRGKSLSLSLLCIKFSAGFFWGDGGGKSYLQHMEVPGLGVKLELQQRAYTATTANSNTGSDPHLRPTPQLTAVLDP